MLKRLTAACLLSFAGLGAAAQLPDSADMSAGGEFRRRIDRHTSTKAYRMLFVGTPLIVGGVVMQAYDSDFRRLRNGYSRSFRHDYDDWLQYAPAGAMVALKACGVRGRSSWGRMLVSDAFSAGLMAIGVNSLKYSCRVMRPDGSSRNSFPSGHTATAFMAATMLHKEYGHRSPWYSIGGYTVATITGVTRQLNNRHWMSDIMVGAGIGILATELGYFLADLIFKEKGLNVTETYSVYDRCRRPSFLGFSLGFSTVPGSYTYLCPQLEPILAVTYGCIVYQEQVIEIFRKLGGYSLGQADNMRRAISKKKEKVIIAERQTFVHGDAARGIPGAIANGVSETAAEAIYKEILDFANYAFNKAHAVCYAKVTYDTAYLKCHYPREYMAALLTSVLDNSDKVSGYINECRECGIALLPPDINASCDRFTVEEQGIRFGLVAIKNIGRGFIQAAMRERESNGKFTSLYDFCSRMNGSEMNKRAVENLIRSGTFDSTGAKRSQLMRVYESIMDSVAAQQRERD